MSDTGKAMMTREEAKQLIQEAVDSLSKAVRHGGASVNVGVQDQRFTKVISWVWAAIGAMAIAVTAWGVNSINELNLKVGILISQKESDVAEIRELRTEVKDLREHLHALEVKLK